MIFVNLWILLCLCGDPESNVTNDANSLREWTCVFPGFLRCLQRFSDCSQIDITYKKDSDVLVMWWGYKYSNWRNWSNNATNTVISNLGVICPSKKAFSMLFGCLLEPFLRHGWSIKDGTRNWPSPRPQQLENYRHLPVVFPPWNVHEFFGWKWDGWKIRFHFWGQLVA